jgi:hypothetical protein
MMHDPNGPADTRMMAIVHDALRRDLARASASLATTPTADRRRAIGRHVEWMADFLHAHHSGEDVGLWPLVRRRDPWLADLVDRMESDHASVAPALAEVRTAAATFTTTADDRARVELADALTRLTAVLLPHLEREEAAMPTVSTVVTAAEWRAIDREHFLDGKSTAELAFEGHWLLDGLDADRAEVVTHQVGPLTRVVLVHAFAARYRKHAIACWGDAGPDAYGPAGRVPLGIPLAGRSETVVEADPAAVWAVVADVTRVPEWSGECRRVEWSNGATTAVPGATFRGENRAGPFRWRRANRIVAADAPQRLVWRTVPTLLYPDSTEWRIELEPVGTGTRVVQSYEVVRAPKVLAFLYSLLVPSHRERNSELDDDLRRLGRVATATTPMSSRR